MVCKNCGGTECYYDTVLRSAKTKKGHKYFVKVRRYRCSNCHSIHRVLPSYLLPYKLYEKEIIQGVISGYITPETLEYEDYPCEATMHRWVDAHNKHLL